MRQPRTWIIAMTAALAGAGAVHIGRSLREGDVAQYAVEPAQRTDAVSQAACGPGPERSHHDARPAAVPSSTAPTAPAATQQAPLAPVSSMLAMLGGAQPSAQLSPQQRKTMARHQYGALLQELALPPGQAERLLELLGEQQTQRRPVGVRRDRAGAAQDSEDAARREQAEIAAVIGEEKAAAFEQLRETLPLRSELRKVRDQLEDVGDPMTPEQHRALLATLTSGGLARPPSPGEGESMEESAQLYGDWVSDRDDLMRESAAKILSPTQLKTLEETRQLNDAMRPRLGASTGAAAARAPTDG